MNRLQPRSKILSHRLSTRVMVMSGAALGLVAGVAAFGAFSTSAGATTPATFTTAKAPVTAAPPNFAPCAAGSTLERGACVVHVVRTVEAPAPASATSATPTTTPAGTLTPAAVAKPAQAASTPAAAEASQAPESSDHQQSSSRSSTPTPRDTGGTSHNND
jgi:predicted component of type VI protein secretion system